MPAVNAPTDSLEEYVKLFQFKESLKQRLLQKSSFPSACLDNDKEKEARLDIRRSLFQHPELVQNILNSKDLDDLSAAQLWARICRFVKDKGQKTRITRLCRFLNIKKESDEDIHEFKERFDLAMRTIQDGDDDLGKLETQMHDEMILATLINALHDYITCSGYAQEWNQWLQIQVSSFTADDQEIGSRISCQSIFAKLKLMNEGIEMSSDA